MWYGMAASAAGGAIQSIAAQMAREKMANTFQNEIQRQQRYRNQAFGDLQTALPKQGVEQARQDLTEGADRRNQAYADIGQTQLGLGAQPDAREQVLAGLLGNNRAQLGAYSDWALANAVRQIRLQDKLNKISNFSAGDAQVFPARMQDAQHSYDQLAFWGQMLSSLGGAAGSFGAMNQAPPPTSTTGYMGRIGGIDAGSNFGGQYSGQV